MDKLVKGKMLCLMLFVIATNTIAQDAKTSIDIWNLPEFKAEEGPYTSDWDTLSRYYTVPGWWRDAKFGAWSHWDPQSEAENGDWYSRGMYLEGSGKASKRGVLKTGLQSGLESRLQSGLESALQTAPKSALKILEQIHINPQNTLTELAKQTGYSRSWVAETMKRLQEQGIIKRVGSDKTGHWEIIG